MQKRRRFLRTLGTLAVAPLLGGGKVLGSNSDSFLSIEELSRKLEGLEEDSEYWELIRSQFSLEKGFTYMNSGTRGAQPNPVIETQRKFIDTNARKVTNYSRVRSKGKVSTFFGVKESEIGFTHNTTEGINIFAQGLDLRRRDEIIMTTREHVGNALPWLNRCRQSRLKVKPFNPAHTPEAILEQINDLITKRTRVIAIPHVTSPTGLVMPLAEICQLARDKGILTCIDGAQSAGVINLDLAKIGCDFYAAGCHKWMLGPLGTGFVYVPEKNLELIKPHFVGAYSDTGWTIDLEKQSFEDYAPSAQRFDFGTQNGGLFAGVASAVDFLTSIGKDKVEKRARSLGAYAYKKLQGIGDQVEMLSPEHPQCRGAMIGFRVKGEDYVSIADRCVKAQFRIRAVPESGLNSLRVSTHIFNSEKQIDDLADFLREEIRG